MEGEYQISESAQSVRSKKSSKQKSLKQLQADVREESKKSLTQSQASMSKQSKRDIGKISAMTSSKKDSSDAGSGSGSGSDDDDEDDDEDNINFTNDDLIYNPESGLRKWLKSRGKELDFEDEQLKKLRLYFGSLDDDGSGSIGTDELEEPLIALGLLDTRAQVDEIVMAVDDDGSGMLEFPEFLSIIKGGSGGASDGADDDGSGAIYQFFKDLTDDKMEIDGNSNIPFSLFITSMRRRKILQSMWAKDEAVKKDGERILSNYKKQLAEKLAREAVENGEVQSKGSRPFSGGSSNTKKSKMGSTSMTGTSNKTKNKENEEQKLIQKKLQELSSFQPEEQPEAEMLLEILARKSKIQ